MRNLPVIGVILAAGLVVSACDIQTGADGLSFDIAHGKAQDTWSRTYEIQTGGRFELINVNGRVSAEPADGASLSVDGRRTAKGRSDEAARELLSKIEIREEVSGSRVRVESRPPRLSGFSSHEVEWTVKVPKGVVIDLRTTNGGVRLVNLGGEIHAQTTNGGVQGKGLVPASIEASAVNGGIELELGGPLDSTATVELTTVNGGVELGIPGDSKATITARAVNGGVRSSDLEIAKESQANDFEARRRLQGTLNGGGARINLNTTNGGVRIFRVGSASSTTER